MADPAAGVHFGAVDGDDLASAVTPRTMVDVAYEGDAPRPRGWCVTLSCGHEFWTPVNPVDTPMVCAQCIDDLVDRARARRHEAP
jgi:hypothetical protein